MRRGQHSFRPDNKENQDTFTLLVLFLGLAWRDPALMRMKPPRPLLETPACPDLAGSEKLCSILTILLGCLGFSMYYLFIV